MIVFRRQQFKMGYMWMLLILLASACQPTQVASTSTQPLTSKPPIIDPTLTKTVMKPLPTFAESTATPSPTDVVPTLAPNGPWLAYLRNGLTVVNQDGTGRVAYGSIDERPACNVDSIQENPLNRLVIFPHTIYIVQPEATWTLVYREWPTCHTDFVGNEKGGLLANIHQSATSNLRELRIYELPSGKILDQFPIMKCVEQCNTNNVGWWEIRWSPNGRYLAFPGMLEGDSSDLYVYDVENREIRRLTSGPDDVGQIWWSPDGSQIIMGEISYNSEYPYTSSVWAVSVNINEVRLLYSFGKNSYPQGLLGWLDNSRFVVYDGTTLFDALDLPAYNLRMVDKDTGETITLVNGGFIAAALDIDHQTVVFYTNTGEDPGVHIFSGLKPNSGSIKMEGLISFPSWDNEIGLFVTFDPCEDDPNSRTAFNYKGELSCLHYQLPVESLSSPDGMWEVILQDGFWLKSTDQQPIRIVEVSPTQIIWRLDSQGLFFIANNVLYYTPLPNVNVEIVDKYPGGDIIYYQWVGGD